MKNALTKDKILAFNMYFNFCNTFYSQYVKSVSDCAKVGMKLDGTDDIANLISCNPDYGLLLFQVTQYEMLFYASLNTLVEGYKTLKVSDSNIDNHLIDKNVEALKQFRHTVFHFQDYLKDKRFGALINNPLLREWGLTLFDLFKDWVTYQIVRIM